MGGKSKATDYYHQYKNIEANFFRFSHLYTRLGRRNICLHAE